MEGGTEAQSNKLDIIFLPPGALAALQSEVGMCVWAVGTWIGACTGRVGMKKMIIFYLGRSGSFASVDRSWIILSSASYHNTSGGKRGGDPGERRAAKGGLVERRKG